MFRTRVCFAVCFLMMCCVLPISAQQPAAAAHGVVPPMVKFSGILTDINSKPLNGVVGVTFSLYKDSQGGAALWMETQNVQADRNGHYSVMLGSSSSQGLPGNLFVSGEARWLGVQAQGQAEQPRTLLMSVPYALKAADAETLGGKPLSAFQLAAPQSNNGGQQKIQPAAEQPNEIRCAGNAACKASFLPVFSTNGGSAKVNNSIVSQSGSNIGIAGSETVKSSANAPAILGQSTGTSGSSNGVEGVTSSASAAGVAGVASTSGFGVYGFSGSGDGVYGQTSGGTAYAVVGVNTGNGVGVLGSSSSGHGVYGETSGAGSYGAVGLNTATGGIGVLGSAPNGDGFYTVNNVYQDRSAGGWVKAMAFVSGFSGAIVSCFNSTLIGAPATVPPCNLTIDKTGTGDYIIDFGFQVDDRFFSIVGVYYTNSIFLTPCTDFIGGCNHTLTPNQVEITSMDTNAKFFDDKFHLIVY